MDHAVVMDSDNDVRQHETVSAAAAAAAQGRAPMAARTRSMSDSGGTPSKLSPSPHFVETSGKTSKDDSDISTHQHHAQQLPVTPRRPSLTRGLGFHVQIPPHQFTPPGPTAASASAANNNNNNNNNGHFRPPPLSPKLDHSQIYASPTNLLPRRSRGLDFSRAATNLHHSILADQPSPGSSPVVGQWAMNISRRRSDYSGPEQSSTSLWSIMGDQERMNISNSLGSNQALGSDLSSSSDDDDIMDEDAEDTFVTTPQISKTHMLGSGSSAGPFGSPAAARGSLSSFQQRQRPRKQPRKKAHGHLGLGFNHAAAAVSKSPSNGSAAAAAAAAKARRESISWQANQLHISSGGETDESGRPASEADGQNGDSRSVVRRVVTRRGNLLPKSKNFARIRAALAEECSPVESEFMREAEIVKQVRESDMDLEPRPSMSGPDANNANPTATAQSSPNLTSHESSMEDVPGEEVMSEATMGSLSKFKQHVLKNSKGRSFWDTFSESSSMGGAKTPPPPPNTIGRGSFSGMSEDAMMESPSLQTQAIFQNSYHAPPSAAEITRRINNKRRRDDDFDPSSFKRRAVSPSLSVHGSPVVQSPLQRDSSMSLGSRPGSTSGERERERERERNSSGGQSESPSVGGTPAFPPLGATGQVSRKGRVGIQGMVDTNDGIMRMSIE